MTTKIEPLKFEIGDLVSRPIGNKDFKGIVIGAQYKEYKEYKEWPHRSFASGGEMEYKVYFFRSGKTLFHPEHRLRRLEVMDDIQV